MPFFSPSLESDQRVILILDGAAPRSQRDIAQAAGLSVGSTNVAINRLLKAGLLRVDRLNSRKHRYILTPRGIAERNQTTLDGVTRTVKNFDLIKKALRERILNAHASGVRAFCIVGENALADAAETVVLELADRVLTCRRVARMGDVPASTQCVLATSGDVGAPPDGAVVVELHNAVLGAVLPR